MWPAEKNLISLFNGGDGQTTTEGGINFLSSPTKQFTFIGFQKVKGRHFLLSLKGYLNPVQGNAAHILTSGPLLTPYDIE